jgi:hypothetical protein
MAILGLLVPGLLRLIYGRSLGECVLGLLTIPLLLISALLMTPLVAIVFWLWNAAEEADLVPD